ncbi:MAG TPA: hypothetical protein VHE35_22165 [Kofleriaceae bacterium]|nr:hypothetical protein [Kofleriaceae bacterium]
MAARTLALVLVASSLAPATARAGGGEDRGECGDCRTRDWIMAEPGVGPEVGALARLELGTTGLGLDDAAGGQAVTAGFARLRLGVALAHGLGVRASGTVQALNAARAEFPFALGADAGGAVGLGVSKLVAKLEHGDVPVAFTLDGELASGPAVRSGLGLRTFADGRRYTVAPGLATAWDFYGGSARGHVRYLRTRADDGAPDAAAVELGLGASMRINWGEQFWGGDWPLEAWLDCRYRRGLGADGDAREDEVRGGLDYTPGHRLDRVGVQLAGGTDHLAGGRTAHALTMLLTLQYGQGR